QSYVFSISIGINPPFIACYDTSGNLVWERNSPVLSSERAVVSKLDFSPDGNLVSSGYEMPICDVTMNTGVVQKLDLQGSTVWVKTFQQPFSIPDFYSFGNGLQVLSNNSIRVSAGKAVYHLKDNGDSLTVSYFPLSIVGEIHQTPDGYLLLACDSGIVKCDTAGNVMDTLRFNRPVNNIQIPSQTEYFFISNRILYKTNAQLIIIDSLNLQTTFTAIKNVRHDNGRLWVLGKKNVSGNDIASVEVFDLNFNAVSSHIYSGFNGSDFLPEKIIIQPDHYVFAGHEKTKQSIHCFMKSFEKTNHTTNNFNNDAGVISMRSDSSYAIHYIASIYNVHINVYATVKNFGIAPLNIVHLNAMIFPMGICLPQVYYNAFQSLNLAPGDSMEFYLGWFHTQANLIASNNFYTQCVWTSSPESKMDVNHSNDTLCTAFLMDTIIGIKELSYENDFNVFPNPCSNLTTVSSTQSPIEFIIIFDVFGREIYFEHPEYEVRNQTIDLSKWSNGFYMIKVISRSREKVIKLVKQ
ncbi:MAG TPA: T9SS type A sorting domain-containing protein, partial [Bacteroidia bacterium]|nr:T9SS type A sorting domain-containing protein [Bacteroidia bacterium]